MYLSKRQDVRGLSADTGQHVLFAKVGIVETAITGNYLFRPSKQMYKTTITVVGGINES